MGVRWVLDFVIPIYLAASAATLWINLRTLELNPFDSVTLWEQLKTNQLSFLLVSNFYLSAQVFVFRCAQWFLFGELTTIETQKLYNRFLHLLLDILTVTAVLKHRLDNIVEWNSWLITLLAMNLFCHLAQLRLKSLIIYSSDVKLWVYLRTIMLLFILFFSNIAWMMIWYETLNMSTSNELWLYALSISLNLSIVILQSIMKYGICLADAALGGTWEHRGSYSYIIDFFAKSITLVVSSINYIHLLWASKSQEISYISLCIIIIHISLLVKNLIGKFKAYLNYRRLTDNLNSKYIALDVSELRDMNEQCVICLSLMTTSARVLPCGHIFHGACLRSWLEYNHTCPSCRLDLISSDIYIGTSNVDTKDREIQTSVSILAESKIFTDENLKLDEVDQNKHDPLYTSLLRSTSPSLSFFPQISFEVVKQADTDQSKKYPLFDVRDMLAEVKNVIPDVPDQVAINDLMVTRNVADTISNILDGQLGWEMPALHVANEENVLSNTLPPSSSCPSEDQDFSKKNSVIISNDEIKEPLSQPQPLPNTGGGLRPNYPQLFQSVHRTGKNYQEKKQLIIEQARLHYLQRKAQTKQDSD